MLSSTQFSEVLQIFTSAFDVGAICTKTDLLNVSQNSPAFPGVPSLFFLSNAVECPTGNVAGNTQVQELVRLSYEMTRQRRGKTR